MTEQHQTEQATFRNIGRGTCGSVFEIPGTAYAIKKGANIAAISNDFSLTNIAYNAYCKSHPFLTQKFPAYQIPRTPAYDSTDTLRNFPLYLDDAQSIGVNVNEYAEQMAIGLAILHWQAQIDAQDTEFVIGSYKVRPIYTTDELNQQKSDLSMWMLDYDKCTEMDLEGSQSEIIRKYLVAVTGNDPYYPHPCLDAKLWRRFREAYLKASQIIITSREMGDKVGLLPGVLIKQWEQWGERDLEANDGDIFERDSSDNKEEEDDDDDTVEEESGSDEDGDDDDSEVDDDSNEEDSNG